MKPREADAEKTDLERLAAFVDGRLEGEDRRAVVAHLADDGADLELVAETLAFLEEEERQGRSAGPASKKGIDEPAGPLPFTAPEALEPAPTSRPWLRFAAAAGIAAAAFFAWQILSPGPDAAEVLIAQLAAEPESVAALDKDWTQAGWPTHRGPNQEAALRAIHKLGARSVTSRAALPVEDLERPEGLAGISVEIIDLLNHPDFQSVDKAKDIYQRLAEEVIKGRGETVPHLVEEGNTALDTTFGGLADYRFGKWVETGRLAARFGMAHYFQHQTFRRDLELYLSGEDPPRVLQGDRGPEIEAQLDEIDELTEQAPAETELRELESAFRRIQSLVGTGA